jgi:hypothetical protein
VAELLINGQHSHGGAEQLARREGRQASAMKRGERGLGLTSYEEPQGVMMSLSC